MGIASSTKIRFHNNILNIKKYSQKSTNSTKDMHSSKLL
jgi:hypothetical protein